MARKTSFEFPEIIEPFLDRLEACYGLKNVISGGILALSRLPADEREMIIAEATQEAKNETEATQTDPPQRLHDTIAMLKEMADIEKQQPGTIYRVLSPEEQKIVDDFRMAVKSKPKKKAKRG